MSTTNTTISSETTRHVLWHFGQPGGWRPTSFTQHLMAAIETADARNQAILRAVYPALSEAVHLARYDEEGLTKLQRIAAGEGPLSCTCGDTAGPFTKDGRCETCAAKTPAGSSFPPRGGHSNPCAYAAGIGPHCSCDGAS